MLMCALELDKVTRFDGISVKVVKGKIPIYSCNFPTELIDSIEIGHFRVCSQKPQLSLLFKRVLCRFFKETISWSPFKQF